MPKATASAQPPGAPRIDHDALIVGAGPAGIATAVALQDAGVTDVLVLERNPEPFGRTREGGAVWEHSSHSALRDTWTKPLGRVGPASDFEGLRIDGHLPTSEQADQLWGNYETVVTQASQAHDQGILATGASLAPAGNLGAAAAELAVGSLASGVDAKRVDAGALATFDDSANTTVKGGFAGLLQEIVERRSIPLQLSTEVTKIRHGDGWAEVSTKDGQKLTARVVELALPLGVLQRGDIEFDPPLSPKKQAALAGLEMSRYEKVILHLGTRAGAAATQPKNSWVTDITSSAPEETLAFFFPEDRPDVVEVHMGGSFAEALAEQGPERMIRTAQERLEAAYGVQPEQVVSARATDWFHEAGGSWIAAAGENHMAHRRELAQGEGVLHLATDGSGPDARLIGSVDGAWDAGTEQGRKMAALLNG